MLEEKIAQLITAVEANTAALKQLHSGAPAASEPAATVEPKKTRTKPAPAAEIPPIAGVSADDIRAESQKLLDHDGATKTDKGLVFLQSLKKRLGCKPSELPADKMGAVLDEIKAEVAKISKSDGDVV